MSYSLEKHVAEFILKYWDGQRGLLLAFSGGVDSLALLHVMISFCKKYPLVLAIAHVDHGWREESAKEAEQIALMAKAFNVAFHLKKLDPAGMDGNLEAACREARLQFFAALCTAFNYQAVLVAHHADDLAETVLKRVLEGSSLPYLSGLKPKSELYGVSVWRPLLEISKKTLIQWAADRSLEPFDDSTNRDPRFLRARLRTRILPWLSQEFGKEISSGLCRIGCDANELRDYLDEKISPYYGRLVAGRFGALLDASRECLTALIEIKHLIKRCCERNGFVLSKENVDIAAKFLLEGAADKKVMMGNRSIYLDRRRLFVTTKEFPSLPKDVVMLGEGEMEYGPWKIKVNACQMPCHCSSNWRLLWQGEAEVILPKGNYQLRPPDLGALYHRGASLSKWWTNHKVPAFLRQLAPVIYQGETAVHEFLTGNIIFSENTHEYIKINMWMPD